MRFPAELWPDESDLLLVQGLVEAFADQPLVLCDRLGNTLYFTASAEAHFAERAEAIVNRLTVSLLGFGEKDRVAAGLLEALVEGAAPWEGIVQLQTATGPRAAFVQASSVRNREGQYLAGVVRIGKVQKQ